MRIGFIGQDVSVFLEALQSTADTNVLANTELLALNKMQGEIIIGGRLGYLGGTTVSNGISQQSVEFLDVGTQLRFRPFMGTMASFAWRFTLNAVVVLLTLRQAFPVRTPLKSRPT